MIGLTGRLFAHLSRMSTAARLAWLNAVAAAVLAAALPVAESRDGAAGTRAVLVAALVSTVSANGALFLASRWHGTPNGVPGALAGTLVGMMPPLFVGFTLQQRGGTLAEGGVFGWMVVFYLTALVVKTVLVAPAPHFSGAPATTSKAGA